MYKYFFEVHNKNTFGAHLTTPQFEIASVAYQPWRRMKTKIQILFRNCALVKIERIDFFEKKFSFFELIFLTFIALSKMSGDFQTPRIRRILKENAALEIPPSPSLKNLGFGTGNNSIVDYFKYFKNVK